MREGRDRDKVEPTPYSDSLKIMTLAMSTGELLALSDLDKNEINSLLALIVMDKQFNLNLTETIVNNYVKMKVSLRRKGREEILRAGQQKAQNIFQLFTRRKTPVVEE